MASATQDKLYETFVAVLGRQDSHLDGTLDSGEETAVSLSDMVKQLGEIQASSATKETGSGGSTPAAGTSGGSGGSTPAAGTSGGGSTPAADTSGGGSGGSTPAAGTSGGGSTPAAGTSGDGGGSTPAAGTSSGSGGSTPAAGTSGGGGGISAESVVSTVLESGLGMVPLIVGLLGLFEGGGTPTPPAPVKYAMPDPIYFEGADIGSDTMGADYDQMGMPRTYSAAPSGADAQGSRTTAAPGSGGGGGTASGAAAPQITVNVQAMDARSFLDHSSEIAQAVRDAMLNLNSINDVVSEL